MVNAMEEDSEIHHKEYNKKGGGCLTITSNLT